MIERLLHRVKWDRWIGNCDREPVFFYKVLGRAFGWTLRLQMFVKADPPGCYHSHPSRAFRLILLSGYMEEVLTYIKIGTRGATHRRWRSWVPGMVGYVAPSFIHRVHALRNGRYSVSLWLHGPKVAEIELHGDGWPEDFVPYGGAKRVRVP